MAALVAAGFVTRLRHGWEWDELQLLHGAWAMAHGQVPYRDFFEHHPPLLHLLLAPFVGGRTKASWTLLVLLRAVALLVLIGVLGAYHRLLGRVTAPRTASWGPVALLVASPISGKLFELRADWLALLAVLAALLSLRSRPRLAGLLLGLAICTSQKAAPLSAGVLAWSLGTPDRDGGRLGFRRTLALVGWSAAPILLLVAAFAWAHAGVALYTGTVGVNLGWRRELDWREIWWESSPAACGILVLALAAVTRLRDWKGDGSLLALLAAIGGLTYVTTPVPWEQSLLFLVTPWVAALAIMALERYAIVPGALGGDVVFLAATLLLISATLPLTAGAPVAVVWLLVGLALWCVVRRARSSARRLQWMTVAILFPGVLMFLDDRVGDVETNRGAAQAAFSRAVERRLQPGEPILVMWDQVLPFRPAATYHWFAHEGVLRRFAREIDAEYVDAVEGGRARVAILDPVWVAEYLPRFRRVVERRCRLVEEGYADGDVYTCDER